MIVYRVAKFEHGDGYVDEAFFLHRADAVQCSKLRNLKRHYEHEEFREGMVKNYGVKHDPGPLGLRGYGYFVIHELPISEALRP